MTGLIEGSLSTLAPHLRRRSRHPRASLRVLCRTGDADRRRRGLDHGRWDVPRRNFSTLPFLISQYLAALVVAVLVIAVELVTLAGTSG